MLSAIYVEVYSYPHIKQDIQLTTWPHKRSRLYFNRDFILTDNKMTPILKAASQWILADKTTRKPQKTSTLPGDMPLNDDIETLHLDSFRIRFNNDDKFVYTGSQSATYSSLDLNNHMTSMRYVQGIENAVSEDILNGRRIFNMKLNFLREVMPGETLNIYRNKTENSLEFKGCVDNLDCFRVVIYN